MGSLLEQGVEEIGPGIPSNLGHTVIRDPCFQWGGLCTAPHHEVTLQASLLRGQLWLRTAAACFAADSDAGSGDAGATDGYSPTAGGRGAGGAADALPWCSPPSLCLSPASGRTPSARRGALPSPAPCGPTAPSGGWSKSHGARRAPTLLHGVAGDAPNHV